MEIFDNVEKVNEPATLDLSEYEDKDGPPDMSDPSWSDYVLSQLTVDEAYDGNPTTDGLRRLAGSLLGYVVRSVPIVCQSPHDGNGNHATIAWELAIAWDNNPTDVRVFGDVADVYSGNTDPKFAVFAAATAATRAEGRALRKALQLKKVVTAEEICVVPEAQPEFITKSQIEFVNMMCERNNINVLKLINSKNYKRIEDMPYERAQSMNKYLSDAQGGREKIPLTIVGYDTNWRRSGK